MPSRDATEDVVVPSHDWQVVSNLRSFVESVVASMIIRVLAKKREEDSSCLKIISKNRHRVFRKISQ